MLGVLRHLETFPFITCVVLRYHFGDRVPWWIWTCSILCLLGDPGLRANRDERGRTGFYGRVAANESLDKKERAS